MQWIAVDQERGLAVVERERRREVARNEAATAARLYRCDQSDEITVLAERQQLGAQAAEGIGLDAHGIVASGQLAILERTRRQRPQVRAGAEEGTGAGCALTPGVKRIHGCIPHQANWSF